MSLLTQPELFALNPDTVAMPPGHIVKYLAQANAYCIGFIGGIPEVIDDTVKAAVATAFEILAEGQSSQTDSTNGNITQSAPQSPFARLDTKNPLYIVDIMLGAAKKEFDATDPINDEVGRVFWLGKATP